MQATVGQSHYLTLWFEWLPQHSMHLILQPGIVKACSQANEV